MDESLRHDTSSIVQGSPVEARAEEYRQQEPLDDRPPATDIDGRAELARWLEPSVFPARPGELVASAERRHSPDWVLDALRRVPDTLYPTTEAVWEAMAGV